MITLFKDPIFEAFDKVLDASRYTVSPQTNIHKTESEYKITMSLPGLTKNDLKISLKEGVLKVSFEKDEKDERTHFVDNFTKSYTIPDDVKEKDIEGKIENGVLELKLPIDKKKPIERLVSLN
jgi:HSP20 family protein